LRTTFYSYFCSKCKGVTVEEAAKQASDGSVVCDKCGALAFRKNPGRRRRVSLWPRWSDAAGVHPSQIREQQEELAQHGVSAEFNSEGQIKFEDPAHERRCLQAMGMYNRNAGYSDAAPKNR